MSLLKKTFVYDPVSKQMVEQVRVPRARVHDIMPDLPDFVSPVDRKVVHGRRGLREHDKRHGTTNIADYKETWKKRQEQRARLFEGNGPSMTETIRRAYDDLRDGRVKR